MIFVCKNVSASMLIIYVVKVKVKVKVTQLCPTLCYQTTGVGSQNTGVGSRCLLQGIFPTQGSNPGLRDLAG